MIGIIISGHGNFATGIQSSLNLISGEFKNVLYVDFLPTDSTNDLKEKYKEALKQLEDCNEILGLTDLVGGSPFKTLVELSVEVEKNIEVIGGVNVPMAIETTMSKDIYDNLADLTNTALNTGKDSIVKFELIETQEDNFEDGI